MSRQPLILVIGFAALSLGGCFTPRVRPTPSKAILQVRAEARAGPAAGACPDLASPESVGFGFGENTLTELDNPVLDKAAAELKCHPQAGAVVVGQADNHGTAAQQRKLASDRIQAVVAELQRRGVAASRIATQVQGAAPAGDAQRLVVLAEGRRW